MGGLMEKVGLATIIEEIAGVPNPKGGKSPSLRDTLGQTMQQPTMGQKLSRKDATSDVVRSDGLGNLRIPVVRDNEGNAYAKDYAVYPDMTGPKGETVFALKNAPTDRYPGPAYSSKAYYRKKD